MRRFLFCLLGLLTVLGNPGCKEAPQKGAVERQLGTSTWTLDLAQDGSKDSLKVTGWTVWDYGYDPSTGKSTEKLELWPNFKLEITKGSDSKPVYEDRFKIAPKDWERFFEHFGVDAISPEVYVQRFFDQKFQIFGETGAINQIEVRKVEPKETDVQYWIKRAATKGQKPELVKKALKEVLARPQTVIFYRRNWAESVATVVYSPVLQDFVGLKSPYDSD